MSFIKQHIERQVLSRRDFLIRSAIGVGSVGAYASFGGLRQALAQQTPTLAWGYRSPGNPYWNAIVAGGESFAASVGEEMTHLIHGGNNEKILADVKSLLSRTGGNLALAVDPNDSPNARAVVEACRASGGYVSTIWNKTEDLHPWDFGKHYVSHMGWSDYQPAQQIAERLFEAMGGEGGVVGIGGIASNVPAIERKAGLMKALESHPSIELLDWQAADWSTTRANNVMAAMLTRFGDEIKGVFSSNDSMTLGILEALRFEGLAGVIPIVSYDGTADVVRLIGDGEVLCTVSTNPYWAGGISLSLAWHAAIGDFDPQDEPHEHREFLGPSVIISQDNVAQWVAEHIESQPDYDWRDFWALSQGPLVNAGLASA